MELFDKIKKWAESVRGIRDCDGAIEYLREFEPLCSALLDQIDMEQMVYQFTPGLVENIKYYLERASQTTLEHIDFAVFMALVTVFMKKAEYDLTIHPFPKRVKARNDRQLELCNVLSTQEKLPIEESEDKEFDITIVMITYNQLRITKDCLESVFQFSDDVSYEVILIDNGSADGSYEYFRNDERIKCIRLPYNVGCLLAMEVFYHAHIDRGRFWLYMNNDVIVTPRWASNMLTCIKSDPSIGLVMPVTNRSAEYLMIDNMPFSLFDIESAKEFGEKYNKSSPVLWVDKIILYAFVGLNRPSARRAFGYYEDAYYYPFYYADGDISHSMKLAGYRIILQRDTYVHHLDGGSSVWKNRRLMLDRGENDFFNKYGYFPTDLHHICHYWSASSDVRSPGNILFLGLARADPAAELASLHRIYGNECSKYFAADVCEKLKIDNTDKSISFSRIKSWYDVDSVFPGEVFDLIILLEPVKIMRDTDRFFAAVRSRLSCNGQFICSWENPANIQVLRYYYMTRRSSIRDACRLMKKSYASFEALLECAARVGLYIEAVYEKHNKEDLYVYGMDMDSVAKLCGVEEDETALFVNRLRTAIRLVSMRNWVPIDEDSKKTEMRKPV